MRVKIHPEYNTAFKYNRRCALTHDHISQPYCDGQQGAPVSLRGLPPQSFSTLDVQKKSDSPAVRPPASPRVTSEFGDSGKSLVVPMRFDVANGCPERASTTPEVTPDRRDGRHVAYLSKSLGLVLCRYVGTYQGNMRQPFFCALGRNKRAVWLRQIAPVKNWLGPIFSPYHRWGDAMRPLESWS